MTENIYIYIYIKWLEENIQENPIKKENQIYKWGQDKNNLLISNYI